MITYERVMTTDDLEDLFRAFASKDWRDVTIPQEILSWNELNVVLLENGMVRVFAVLSETRVYAGVILRNRGFSVK